MGGFRFHLTSKGSTNWNKSWPAWSSMELTNPELLAMYRSSALPMKRKMVQLSGPGRTGLLAKSISVRRAKKNRNDGARFVVGPRAGSDGCIPRAFGQPGNQRWHEESARKQQIRRPWWR